MSKINENDIRLIYEEVANEFFKIQSFQLDIDSHRNDKNGNGSYKVSVSSKRFIELVCMIIDKYEDRRK